MQSTTRQRSPSRPVFRSPSRSPQEGSESWKAVTNRVHSDLAALLRENQTLYAARRAPAVEERNKLIAAVDQFEKERIQEVEDAAIELNETARKKAAEYIRQLRRAAADLRSKESESSAGVDPLLERYRLTAIEL